MVNNNLPNLNIVKKRDIRILITGSKDYVGKTKVKDLIFNLKNKIDDLDRAVFFSRGATEGVDLYVKEACQYFNLYYKEFNPYYEEHTVYSYMPPFRYYKEYSAKLMYIRDNDSVKNAKMIFLFINTYTKSLKYIYDRSIKLGKSVIIYNQ